MPVLSIRDAVFTVSPKRQYLGAAIPITPAATDPLWNPIRTMSCSSGLCASLKLATNLKSIKFWANGRNCFVIRKNISKYDGIPSNWFLQRF